MTRDPKAARQHIITVDGEDCTVWTAQSGQRTITAYGPFRDHHLRGTGRSESEALSEWRRQAEYQANS